MEYPSEKMNGRPPMFPLYWRKIAPKRFAEGSHIHGRVRNPSVARRAAQVETVEHPDRFYPKMKQPLFFIPGDGRHRAVRDFNGCQRRYFAKKSRIPIVTAIRAVIFVR